MRKVLAAIVFLAGIALAIYVGLWLMFVGGISQVIDAAQEDPVEGGKVAWGVVRTIFAGTATAFTFWAVGFLAWLIGGFKDDINRRW